MCSSDRSWGKTLTMVGAAAFAGALAIGAPLAAAVKGWSDVASEMVDAADRTNTSVQSLSELRFAAEQNGAAFEDLEKSLSKMNMTIAEAAQGAKPAVKVFAQLGLNVHELSKLSPDERLAKIADALAKIKDHGLRASLAMDIFGKSALKLMPLLSLGAKGIKDLREEAKRLGISLSDEDARAAEAFGDQLQQLYAVIGRLRVIIGSALLPMMRNFVGSAIDAAKAAALWVKEHAFLAQMAMATAAGLLAISAVLTPLGTALKLLSKSLIVVRAAWMGVLWTMGLVKAGCLLLVSAFSSLSVLMIVVKGVVLAVQAAFALISITISAVTTLVFALWGAFGALASVGVVAGLIAVVALLGVFGRELKNITTGALRVLGSTFGEVFASLGRGFAALGGWARTAFDQLASVIRAAAQDGVDAWQVFKQAMTSGDWQSAAQVVWALIKLEWQRGVNYLTDVWGSFKEIFLKAWNDVVLAFRIGWVDMKEIAAKEMVAIEGKLQGWDAMEIWGAQLAAGLPFGVEREQLKEQYGPKADPAAEKKKAEEKERRDKELKDAETEFQNKLEELRKKVAEGNKVPEGGLPTPAKTTDPKDSVLAAHHAGTSALEGTFSSMAGRMFGDKGDQVVSTLKEIRDNLREYHRAMAMLGRAGRGHSGYDA